jgi:hypothetical protein
MSPNVLGQVVLLYSGMDDPHPIIIRVSHVVVKDFGRLPRMRNSQALTVAP